jgi:2-polyprenyl-6-methoxyphenol hydroxylase-like FAD-dependent oxidoreductase
MRRVWVNKTNDMSGNKKSRSSSRVRLASQPCDRKHAVVIGGSIAGLLTARVLSEHFARVTVIERDHLPNRATARKGTPQSRHVHVLLMRGQLILERLFRGIMQELRLAGAPAHDSAADVLWLTPAGWAKRFQSGMVKLNASRDLLEYAVRRRLTGCDNVRVIDECSVAGLISTHTGQVSGVRLRCRGVTGDGRRVSRFYTRMS